MKYTLKNFKRVPNDAACLDKVFKLRLVKWSVFVLAVVKKLSLEEWLLVGHISADYVTISCIQLLIHPSIKQGHH